MHSISVCTIIDKCLVNAVVLNDKSTYWVKLSVMHDLRTFLNDIIIIVGVITTTVNCNNCTAKDVKVTIVEVGHRPVIGRDLFS